jgi:serine/threonine-protein kinase
VHRIATSAPIPPRVLRAQIPAGLEAVVLKCIEKDRDLRYPDVGALARAIAPFAGPHARVASERVTQILAVSQRAKAQRSPIPQAVPRPTLRFWPHATTVTGKRAVRVGMIASGVLAVGALWLAQSQLNDVPPPAAEPRSEPLPVLPAKSSLPSPDAVPAPTPPAIVQPVPLAGAPALPPSVDGQRTPSSKPVLARSSSSTRSRTPSARDLPRTPTAVPAAPITPIDEPREPTGGALDRDASVRSMGDDLRPLRDAPRKRRQLDDPFR